MTHIISLISLHLISLFSYGKMYSRKDNSPNYIEFSKIKQALGDLLRPKNPTRGIFILNPAFNYSRQISLDNSKKVSKEKQSRQLEKVLFTMVKTLDSSYIATHF